MFCANLHQAVLVCDALAYKNKLFNQAIQLCSVSVLCTLKNTAAQQYILNYAIRRLANTAGWSSTLHPVAIFNRSQLHDSPHVAAGHPFNLMRYGRLPAGPMSDEAINIYFQIMPSCIHCELLYHSPALRLCPCMHIHMLRRCVCKSDFFPPKLKNAKCRHPLFCSRFSPHYYVISWNLFHSTSTTCPNAPVLQ